MCTTRWVTKWATWKLSTLAATMTIMAPPKEAGYPYPIVVGKIMRDTKIPEPIRQRWLREGFMRVDAGFLRKDRYVHADQIDMVTKRMVRLNVNKDDLSTF
jgi:hypothetical protein